MCFGQTIVERQRLIAHGENRLERNWFGRSQVKEGIAVGYAGVSARIRWIERGGLDEHLARRLVTRFRTAMEKFATFQVTGVSLDIICRRLLDRDLLLRQKLYF